MNTTVPGTETQIKQTHAATQSVTASTPSTKSWIFNTTVWVAALGYFVDMYDLSLFGIVRMPSLKAIGVTDPAQLLIQGAYLANWQMTGMMVGGVLWGILGDRRGRLSVLFGSILLYSLANIANAFVGDLTSYAALRFLAGLGLAGELGAAITLVAEVMPKEVRGYGTTIVATLGLCGSAAAGIVGDTFQWQTAYIVGGVMGLFLLVTRFKIFESGMFEKMHHAGIRKGDVMMLFSKERFPRYLSCILIGVPIYFVTGVLISYSPEFAKAIGVTQPVTVARAVLFVAIGLALGDLASGLFSQYLKSRKKAVGVFLLGAFAFVCAYLTIPGMSVSVFYGLCLAMGICAGYWAVLVTIASEQFGTNLRATVTTTVPNFVRGSLVLGNLSFTALMARKLPIVECAMIVGGVAFCFAFIALWKLQETYGKELNYTEH
ncbi:MAG: MFS transporter [Bdellovibrionia bacterium]